MIINGIEYNIMGVYNNSITLPDSFASYGNKFGKGHGEAKLYIGPKPQMNNFFEETTRCFILKVDFEQYRASLQSARTVLSSLYRKSIGKNKNFDKILEGIDVAINRMHNIEYFEIKLMNTLSGPRGYINSANPTVADGYYYLRACCLPFVSFIRLLKLEEIATGTKCFYVKLFPNFDEMYQQVQYIKKYGTRNISERNDKRPGQKQYKRELVQEFNECPFTHIKDERLLVASHILPFASCDKSQKYDPKNGLLLSPLYDRLFDRGFITFNQSGQLKKTIWLSADEWKNIPLNYLPQDLRLTQERKDYLQFHEQHVFLGD